jgi:hypothetical protein
MTASVVIAIAVDLKIVTKCVKNKILKTKIHICVLCCLRDQFDTLDIITVME